MMTKLFRIKICGITSAADARVAAAAGADAIGLNFYASSPRFVELNMAREIADAVTAGVAKVGVFVNATAAEIRATAEAVGLDYVQLHGDEPPENLSAISDRPIIKAFRCRETSDRTLALRERAGVRGKEVLDYLQQCHERDVRLAGVLLDAHVAGQFGGTGAKLDWPAVNELQKSLDDLPVLLAGGLTADNVAAAIAEARPHGVDVASGVEATPGKKEARLVERFVAEAKRAFTLG